MHSLQKTIFLIILFFSSLLSAQEPTSEVILDQYNELVNYVPKSLENDTIYNPENPISKIPLNTLVNVKLYYGLKHYKKFTEKDIEWMEDKIVKLATALHADGKYILVGKTGGASGCLEKNLLSTIQLNMIQIIGINFCHTCTDSHIDEDFIEIFNSRMYQLLQIKRPDYTTHRFYGTFKGKGENRSKIELTMTPERTFTLTIQHKDSLEFSEGIWENDGDILILKSKKITQSKDRNSKFSTGNWIQFDNANFQLKYRFRKSKLIKLGAEKWKLKKQSPKS